MRPIVDLIIYEEDLTRLNACLTALHQKTRGRAVLLVDTSGQLIASAGETDGLDTTPLASLAAGSIAAAGALAQLLGEKEFSFVVYDGERKRLHLSLIGSRAILLVLLDQKSAVTLVRLQVKKFSREIVDIFDHLSRRPRKVAGEKGLLSESGGGEITDADVENLFDLETDGLDTTPLASLAAGSIAAAGALAQLLGEKEFSFVVYDGERKRLHLSLIGSRAILLVLLDQKSAVTLVRLQVKKFSREIVDIFDHLSRRPRKVAGEKGLLSESGGGEITDADVENLFDKG